MRVDGCWKVEGESKPSLREDVSRRLIRARCRRRVRLPEGHDAALTKLDDLILEERRERDEHLDDCCHRTPGQTWTRIARGDSIHAPPSEINHSLELTFAQRCTPSLHSLPSPSRSRSLKYAGESSKEPLARCWYFTREIRWELPQSSQLLVDSRCAEVRRDSETRTRRDLRQKGP